MIYSIWKEDSLYYINLRGIPTAKWRVNKKGEKWEKCNTALFSEYSEKEFVKNPIFLLKSNNQINFFRLKDDYDLSAAFSRGVYRLISPLIPSIQCEAITPTTIPLIYDYELISAAEVLKKLRGIIRSVEHIRLLKLKDPQQYQQKL